jgi:hypothetical protein
MLYKRNSRHRPIPRSETSIASITKSESYTAGYQNEAIEEGKASNKKFHL